VKLTVNHKGEQKLIVSKPDAAVIAKAKPLLALAAVFFKLDPLDKAIVDNLCDKIAATQVEADDAPVQQELPFEQE